MFKLKLLIDKIGFQGVYFSYTCNPVLFGNESYCINGSCLWIIDSVIVYIRVCAAFMIFECKMARNVCTYASKTIVAKLQRKWRKHVENQSVKTSKTTNTSHHDQSC